ncbi:hypothetical protein [Actinomadura sp. NTSP31]|uniref:hypothetical protein n=1 Tax=Actinomadura sp. NTSP31 TaxID=1735447 RepID=UPI0035BF863F
MTMKIGLCGVCEGEHRTLQDGTLRKHNTPDGAPCPGSRRNPAAILPLTFRRWLTTQANRHGHGRDLYIGRLARAAQLYGDDWTTTEDLADAMGAAGVNPNAALVRYLTEAADEYKTVLESARQT